MYYYYDLLLNFGEEEKLYEFYEWEKEDSIDFVKKIPLYRFSNTILKDLLESKVKFPNSFLEEIKHKTFLKGKEATIEYACLLCDTKEAIAIECNKIGEVIGRSKLLLNDEMNLNEIVYSMKETKINYEWIKKYSKKGELRQIEKIKKLIKCEIRTLYKSKNTSKLKYLYYEWFNKMEKNIEKIKQEMEKCLASAYDKNLEKIYNVIKISYNKVN